MTTMTRPPETGGDAAPETEGGSRKKLVVVVLLVLVLAAGAAWWFMLRGGAEGGGPEPGEVVPLDPIQVNLAEGHYLSIGVALQTVSGAHEVDGSQALDAVIDLFSGREMEELLKPKARAHLKDELTEELGHLYHDEVMGVYFTQFVTQ